MALYTTYELGDTAKITVNVTDSVDTLVDPDSIVISIFKESDSSTVVDAVDMTKSTTGIYYYNWDTTSQDLGQYKIKIKALFGSLPQVNTKFLELVEVKVEWVIVQYQI